MSKIETDHIRNVRNAMLPEYYNFTLNYIKLVSGSNFRASLLYEVSP
jgi:hypothetical protein